MSNHAIVAACFCALVLSACKTPEEGLVGKPPEDEAAQNTEPTQVTQSDKGTSLNRPRFPAPRLTIQGWPWVENQTTFVLTWSGSPKPLPLHEAPDPNSRLIGDVSWDKGQRVLWNDTAVASYQPRVLQATAEWAVEGPVQQDGYLVNEEFVALEIKKGDRIEVWAYAGDGRCYMSQRGKIFVGECPPPDRFKGLAKGQVRAEWYMPVQKIWWVQITGSNVNGWVPVDDRMIVDIEVR